MVLFLEKLYTVYRHITPDGKSYIGCTSNTIRERWNQGYQHNVAFAQAYHQYGWNGMTHEILADNLKESIAYDIEREMISKYQSDNPAFGYNISMGGKATYARLTNTGAVFTEKHRKNLSKALKGNMVGMKNPMYGKPKSIETIQKQYESHKQEMKKVVQKDLDGNILNIFLVCTRPQELLG